MPAMTSLLEELVERLRAAYETGTCSIPLYKEAADAIVSALADRDRVRAEALETLQRSHLRYEYLRALNPREFAVLWGLNISSGKPFDALVDEAIDRSLNRPACGEVDGTFT